MTSRVESFGDELTLLRITTTDLELVFAPTLGGRLLSLVAEGRELLWRNPELIDSALSPARPLAEWPANDGGMSSWANVGGSKTWPAPQGWTGSSEWAGPPDRVLDSGVYSARWKIDDAAVVLTLASPDDPLSGLRITRRFSIPANGSAFTQRSTFENISSVERRWAIWEVCQVDTAASAGLPVEQSAVRIAHLAEPVELDLGSYEGNVESERDGYAVLLPLGSGVAKRGYPLATGPVSYRDISGVSLQLATSPPTHGEWPDGGSRVEVWLQRPTARPIASLDDLHPAAHLVELEVLGPITALAPGETSSLDIRWSVAKEQRQ